MAETTLEKATCESCGVDVRENTLFCYNCGTRVAMEPTGIGLSVAETNGTNSADKSAASSTDQDEELARIFRVDDIPGAVAAPNVANDRRLSAVIEAWPTLPEPTKAGIVAMVRASRVSSDRA